MAQGKSNAAIAAALFVTERAVEKHTNSIFAKLGLSEEKDVNRRVKAVLRLSSATRPGRETATGWRLATPRGRWATPWPQRLTCDAKLDSVTSHPRSVLVVDDQAPFRLAARAVLRRLDGFEFAGEASSGPEAIELAEPLHPALILMDINMPEMNGIEATRQIVAAAPRRRGDPVLDLRRDRPAARPPRPAAPAPT